MSQLYSVLKSTEEDENNNNSNKVPNMDLFENYYKGMSENINSIINSDTLREKLQDLHNKLIVEISKKSGYKLKGVYGSVDSFFNDYDRYKHNSFFIDVCSIQEKMKLFLNTISYDLDETIIKYSNGSMKEIDGHFESDINANDRGAFITSMGYYISTISNLNNKDINSIMKDISASKRFGIHLSKRYTLGLNKFIDKLIDILYKIGEFYKVLNSDKSGFLNMKNPMIDDSDFSNFEIKENINFNPYFILKYLLLLSTNNNYNKIFQDKLDEIIKILYLNVVILDEKNFNRNLSGTNFIILTSTLIEKFNNNELLKEVGDNIDTEILKSLLNIDIKKNTPKKHINYILNSDLILNIISNDNIDKITNLENKIYLFMENYNVFLNNKESPDGLIDTILKINSLDRIKQIRTFFSNYYSKNYTEDHLNFIIENRIYNKEIIKNEKLLCYTYDLVRKNNIKLNILDNQNALVLEKIITINNSEELLDIENIIKLLNEGRDLSIYFNNKILIGNFINDFKYIPNSYSSSVEITQFLSDKNNFIKETEVLKSEIIELYKKHGLYDLINKNKILLGIKEIDNFSSAFNLFNDNVNKFFSKKTKDNRQRNEVIKKIFEIKDDNAIYFLENLLGEVISGDYNDYNKFTNDLLYIANNKHKIVGYDISHYTLESLVDSIDNYSDKLTSSVKDIYGEENFELIEKHSDDDFDTLKNIGKYINKEDKEDLILNLNLKELNGNNLSDILSYYSLFSTLGLDVNLEDVSNLLDNNIDRTIKIWENIDKFKGKNITKEDFTDYITNGSNEKVNELVNHSTIIQEKEITTFHNRYLLKNSKLDLSNIKSIGSIESFRKLKKL